MNLKINVCLLIAFAFASAFPGLSWGQTLTEKELTRRREEMVKFTVEGAGVKDPRVLKAIRETLRHEFMPRKVWEHAYIDGGISIGKQQTISSPFIVAYMTESLDPQPTDRVLEIGTGSGYQAAILSPLVAEVYSIEIIEELGVKAKKTLDRLGYENVFTKIGDGYLGWEEHAPFDKIIVTCSPENVPQPLINQLAEGGRLIVPMGERHQQMLFLFEKRDGEMVRTALQPTLFVPMTGAAEEKREIKPDPANPVLLNPDFEEGLDESGFVSRWYYERLLTLEEDPNAPSGSHFIKFDNPVPGQNAHLMQGVMVDGRQVSRMVMGVTTKYQGVVKGPGEYDLASFVVAFYDKDRQEIHNEYFGPFVGTQAEWKAFEKEIAVPKGSREVIVRIGLFGATGSISFDKVVFRKVR
ncbi:MAG: protein-L-isoaspartate(D-aspartate) O-methyltransferase [Pirellulaceae bacterium]|jgi:protein-L-isoaspartate(D-aspartate) O-methyltransferase|nr:protein-L-isoaspartate(D-aspartate) O-methyltransferase [Pirellulaceae bacterium]